VTGPGAGTAGSATAVPVADVPALTCRGCGDPGPRRVLDLGRQPASDDFPPADSPGPDARWPLELWICPGCALVQLGPVQALLEEPVLAVESRTSRAHARRVATALLADLPQLVGRPVREFASHHGGSWLEALYELGCRPAAPGERAGLVVDAHALAHEQDVAASLARRAAALAPDGLLVLEHHHLLPLVTEGQFDTVRHGHWSYLSLTTLDRLAGRHGLRVVLALPEAVFGGSLRVVLASADAAVPVDDSVPALLAAERAAGLDDGSGLEPFGRRARESAAALREFLVAERDAGRRVLGYGAPSKAAVLLGLADVGPDLLPFTVDAAPLKHGRVISGARVPIRPVADLQAARPDRVLVLTWDIADEVVSQLEGTGGWGARYVLPLPAPHLMALRDAPGAAP
jgi:C-methyltransferase C-terminal domain/Putative zinc binding domain